MKDSLIKILVSILMIIIGIVFLLNPEIDTTKLMMIISVIIFIGGLIEFVGYFMAKSERQIFIVFEALSFMILGGVIFFYRERALASILFAVAIWLIVLAAINIVRSLRMEKTVIVTWWIPLVWGLLQLIFGGLHFVDAFRDALGVNRYLGIAFILIGFGNLTSVYFKSEKVQKKERDQRRKERRERYKEKDPFE